MRAASRLTAVPRWAWHLIVGTYSLTMSVVMAWATDNLELAFIAGGFVGAVAVTCINVAWQDQKRRRVRSVARARAEHAAREVRIAERESRDRPA